MASIFEQVYSLSGYEREHLFRIITSLDAAGFDLHSKREGFVLRHINTDSLPFLNDSERATLRHLATGEPWREAQKRRQDIAEWWRSVLSVLPCWTLSGEQGINFHVQEAVWPAVAADAGDPSYGRSAVLAPSQQQPLCRRRAHHLDSQEVPAGVPKGAE